jgi:FAD synthetase
VAAWGDADRLELPEDEAATVAIAQGTFELLHPGHLHYLREAAARADHVVVIVARTDNVTHKRPPVVPGRQRRDMVAAVDAVDCAVLGHPDDIFVPVERIDPDVICLGHDQHHDAAAIESALRDRGIDCAIERFTARDPAYEGELCSTGDIVDQLLSQRSGD